VVYTFAKEICLKVCGIKDILFPNIRGREVYMEDYLDQFLPTKAVTRFRSACTNYRGDS
jgi:hypothetical protein